MYDIFHCIANHDHVHKSTEELACIKSAAEDAYVGVIEGIRVIGSLAVAATGNEDYSDSAARGDLFLIGTALTQLTRIAAALEFNSENANYELTRRKSSKGAGGTHP